jgi:hypothetical protein
LIAKTLFWTLLLGLIASFGWHYREAPFIQRWLNPPPPVVTQERTWRDDALERPAAAQPAQAAQTVQKSTGGMRKCRQGASVVYTDGDCPAGSQEHSVGGTVTVLKDQRKLVNAAKTPQSADTALPLTEDPVMRAKRMEQVIDQ